MTNDSTSGPSTQPLRFSVLQQADEEVRCLGRMLHCTDEPFMFSALSGEGMRWLRRLTEHVQSDDRQPRLRSFVS